MGDDLNALIPSLTAPKTGPWVLMVGRDSAMIVQPIVLKAPGICIVNFNLAERILQSQ